VFATDDTIVAIATPAGRAGLGVVRISGPATQTIAAQLLLRKKPLAPRRATLTRVRDLADAAARAHVASGGGWTPSAIDSVVATLFPGPGSYTGEDTIEISAHGSPVVLERIVASAVSAGARMARPGEFTLRAYVNGRIDLVQAEAVGDLIDAVTPAQARQAFDQLSGGLTDAIAEMASELDGLIARLEASLDFPEEGYHFADSEEIARVVRASRDRIRSLLEGSRRGRVIREGRELVLVGGPNVGKSSLFNALIGVERAIVTDVPGTTRDLVTERCEIEGSPLTLVDTAGLRESAERVEEEGIRRTRRAAASSSLVLVVVDRSRPLAETRQALDETAGVSTRVVVASKADLPAAWNTEEVEGAIAVSALTGSGLASLRAAIGRALVGESEAAELPRLSNVRHIGLLERAQACLGRALEQAMLRAPEELLVIDLHDARGSLDEVVGRRTPDDVLAKIFAEFCIGK
jgi:tRNA modification GTPase